ncbi:MAG: NAD(P)H-dependent glycerol-3-phosphate dehydrogenase [Rhodothermales bacterium]|nr:NAD(P)H-dependent glycerol-3-phosphate dehydrogenase [Rhodothermales bacterium]
MPDLEAHPIAVLGAGSWGTALAYSLSTHGGHRVRLWARRESLVEQIRTERVNGDYLPGAELPPTVSVTASLEEAVGDAALVVFATPSQAVRKVAEQVEGLIGPDRAVISVAKGIERETLLTTSQVLCDALPRVDASKVGVLYGPSHAEEVAAGQPTTVVTAMPDLDAAHAVQHAMITDRLRIYVNEDLIGVEIAGSVKNVIALAAGMSDGVGLGDNAKAALVTRGLAEVKRLGLALGADPLTFAGLAGLGDLVVTCFSRHSRNRHFGEEIGRGKPREAVEAEMKMVAEGVATTESVRALARRERVEMPITEAVYQILFEGLKPREAVVDLMTRAPQREMGLREIIDEPDPAGGRSP